jgi:hypothetical protein
MMLYLKVEVGLPCSAFEQDAVVHKNSDPFSRLLVACCHDMSGESSSVAHSESSEGEAVLPLKSTSI